MGERKRNSIHLMETVSNENLSLQFDVPQSGGISIVSIRDEMTGRQYLPCPSMLFEFAVDNRQAYQSDTGVTVDGVSIGAAGSFSVIASALHEALAFRLTVSLAAGALAATVQLSVTNAKAGGDPIFLRVVMPKIRGLVTGENLGLEMGLVPTEIGSLAPLYAGSLLGMPVNLGYGLPESMNNMELASLYDSDRGGGVFFADANGDVLNGIAPLQFNLSETEVVAFWIATIASGQTATLPTLAIGVHHDGDWHAAVDFYASLHRAKWIFPQIPIWFREAGAIYACPPAGAGSIYLSYPSQSLADGIVWNTWEDNNGAWRDGLGPDGRNRPIQVSGAGFAPAGAQIATAKQNDSQLGVFVVGNDGAVWVTWETGDGPWRDSRNGRTAARVTPLGVTQPGAPLFAYKQPGNELDVFYVGNDGAIWVTWERDDSTWRDGNNGNDPLRISPSGLAPAGAHLAAAQQRQGLFDVFVVGNDGAIWLTWSDADSALGNWRDGGSSPPVRVTPPGLAPPGAPLVAAKQHDDQLNVFVVGYDGAVWVSWERADSAWRDGYNARVPLRVTPQQFAPPGAHLAAGQQSADQLDVFLVGFDGAIYITWETGDSVWRDGSDGRNPVPITTVGLAVAGAPLAATYQTGNRWNVFVVGQDGGIWLTWEDSDGAWRDGIDGRAGPVAITPLGIAPSYSGVAAIQRSDTHMDAFTVGSGRIRSFNELPKLLAEANGLGTSVVYLNDYWEGSDEGGDVPYWNKGDYIPRADLGGEAAFKAGIDAIHSLGGRLLVYIEPFIIYRYSNVGKANGLAWAARDPDGNLYPDFADNYTMAAPFVPWQNYIANVVSRLVGQYGVDGIYLDSYGWRMNRRFKMQNDDTVHSAQEWAQGVLALVDRVRGEVRNIKEDGVVMGETTAGPIALHWDGGLDADFGLNFAERAANQYRLIAAPARYAIPELNIFSNGLSIGELHQVYAAGYGLALCSNWPGSFMFDSADHIRKLVETRGQYKDALIYGNQTHQPQTSNSAAVAYYFQGVLNRVVTLVNTAITDQTTDLILPSSDANSMWTDVVSGEVFSANNQSIAAISLPAGVGSLRVFVKI